VIGGLLSSTLLTLVMVPAVYTIVDDFKGFLARTFAHPRPRSPRPPAVAGATPAAAARAH
jgi:hypothetical protein